MMKNIRKGAATPNTVAINHFLLLDQLHLKNELHFMAPEPK